MPHERSAHPDENRRLAERLLALEESHTFLARSLEVLSGEIHDVGTALRDLARRMDRWEQRIDGTQGPQDPSDAGIDD
jgi:hypothetical protein